MLAGRLRYKLELLEPRTVANGFGEEQLEYVATRTVRAERVKLSGNRSEEVAEHFADYRVEFNIRDAHTVSENWRVRQPGGYTFTVVNIIPNPERGMLTLVCERLNP